MSENIRTYIYNCVKLEAFTAVSIKFWPSGYENEQFYDGYRSFGGTLLSTVKPACSYNQEDHIRNNRRPYMGYKRHIHVILPCKLGGTYSRQYSIVAGEVALGLLSLRVLRSSPVIVVSPVLHTFHLVTTVPISFK